MLSPDVIFYRNVSIYFPGVVQRKVFGKLADLLGEGGYLIVGASETLHHDVGILTLMERDGLFFYRKLPGITIEERRATRRVAPRRDISAAVPLRSPQSFSGLGAGERPATRTGCPASTMPGGAKQAPSAAPFGGDGKGMFDEALELAVNGRTDAALAMLETLTDLDRSFVKAHTLKGSILLSESRFDEAHHAGETALSLDPLCLEASLILGIIARHEDDDDEAFKRFREAIYLNPNCWLAHFHMAEMAFGREDKKRARSAYAKALEILENGSLAEHGRDYFPLAVKADQFLVICLHKLSLLKEKMDNNHGF
jgi:chemotaxis protein methyltransferase CheR